MCIMNKIIEVALTGKFGAEAVTNLMEVILATPNPEMATEILLGVYEKPEIPNTIFENNVKKTVVSVDYWQNIVSYSYEEEVRKHLYVEDSLDTSVITLENWKQFDNAYGKSNIKSFYLPTGEIKTKQSHTSIGDWLSRELEDYALAM
jgi:hypothetical protein